MSQKLLPIIIATTLGLAGCSTYDAYTGEQKTSNTAIGASIGAGVGAVLSYMSNKDASSKDRKRRLLRAAGIGAIAGAGVGYYMDQQEAELRKQLRGTGVSVKREGDRLNLIMPGNITFATDSGNLRSDFYDVLNSVGIVLNKYEKTIIVVSGHTDSTGSASYNQRLSEQRASSVANYLRTRNINPNRIEVVGFGEQYPIADNSSAAGREQNRRVELTLEAITEAN